MLESLHTRYSTVGGDKPIKIKYANAFFLKRSTQV